MKIFYFKYNSFLGKDIFTNERVQGLKGFSAAGINLAFEHHTS